MKYLKGILICGIFVALTVAIASEATKTEHGFDFSDLDTSVNACVDFDAYANGGWKKKHEIPAAYPSWGSFNILAENNRDVLHGILEETAKNVSSAAPGSNEQKVGDFFAT